MRLEIDIPEHHYNNIMSIDSISLGRAPYKGIIMYAINAIKQGKVLEQEPATKSDLGVDAISRQALLNATVKKSSIWSHITNSDGDNLEAIISKLPPVTPQLSSGLEKNSKKLEKDFGKSDCVSRADALALYCDKCGLYNCISKCASYRAVEKMPSVTPQEPKTDIKLTNSEWVDFLAKQFDISRTSAKEMLHVMMSVKKEDNFKKQFSGRK